MRSGPVFNSKAHALSKIKWCLFFLILPFNYITSAKLKYYTVFLNWGAKYKHLEMVKMANFILYVFYHNL